MKKEMPPKFMMIYLCSSCGLESGCTEKDKPFCYYCNARTSMKLISKKELTPEVMAARLKKVTDSMLSNIQSAFETMTEEDKKLFSEDVDPEKEMLLLLDKVKKLKDDIQSLELKVQEDNM